MNRWLKIAGIAFAVLVVVLIAGSLVLDSVLNSKARAQAQVLSQQWHRPVRIGRVSTRIFTGLGAGVSDVEIGPAKGETAPLVQLRQVEVRVGILPRFHVRSAEARGLTVNVERFADGSTNLDRFQEQLPKQEAPQKEEPSDLSWLRVDHAALRDGKVALRDRNQTLAIDHLDVTADDLRAGKALEVRLAAAVLAAKQNLQVRVKTAPLPKSLTPTPVSLSLHADPPIDLAPLGPFAGKAVGLLAGTLAANFDAELGGAVPGGQGPTAVKGIIRLTGLQFRGAEGGKKLDVALDADLKGDASKGDVQIDKLLFDAGPASITGHGRAQGLGTSSPRIEGLQIQSHDLDLEKLAEYYPPLRKQLGGQIAGPIGLTVQGAGQTLEARVDLTPVKLSVPEQLSKAAGAPMALVARFDAEQKFEVTVDLSGVDLRPGGSLAKAPGQRLDLAAAGARSGGRVELADLKAHVNDSEVQGKGFYEQSGEKRNFDVQLGCWRLDLDKLLLPGTQKKKKASEPLEAKDFAGLTGRARVQIGELTYRKQTVSDVVADIAMNEDDVKLNTATLKAFGGTATASGSELRLAHPQAPMHVVAKLDQVGLDKLIPMLITDHKLLGGKFNGSVDLQGEGDWAKTLAGHVEGHLLDGVFYGKDVVAGVSGPLAKALPFGVAGKEGQGGSTSLGKDLPVSATAENGMARLKQPLQISTPQADMSFLGGVRADGQLSMPGTVKLTPATVGTITGGRVKPSQPVPVSLELVGPAWSPSVTSLDLKPAVNQIVKEGGSALVSKALGVDSSKAQEAAQKKADAVEKSVEDEARNRLKGLLGR